MVVIIFTFVVLEGVFGAGQTLSGLHVGRYWDSHWGATTALFGASRRDASGVLTVIDGAAAVVVAWLAVFLTRTTCATFMVATFTIMICSAGASKTGRTRGVFLLNNTLSLAGVFLHLCDCLLGFFFVVSEVEWVQEFDDRSIESIK